MTTVYNHSLLQVEDAKICQCPRCKGFGGVAFIDEDGCKLCNGWGQLWVSTTGSSFVRAKWFGLYKSELF